MTEEQHLRAQLAELHRSYLTAVEPIVKRLAEIEAAKPFDPRLVLLRARDLMAARMEEQA
jgi:hypothetical protein